MTSRPTRKQFQGCLVGQALGDALGFVVEGQPPTFCRRYVEERLGSERILGPGGGSFPLGQYSDDTQLARELMQSYAACGRFDPEDYARRIAAIFLEGRIVGRGRATEEAAKRLARGVPWDEAGTPPPSARNSSAMRAAPIGLLFYDDLDSLAQAAREQGFITHRDTRCAAGAVAVAGAVALALREGSVEPLDFLWRLFKEIKRRTRVVGVFPNETSAASLATEIALRSSEEWALKRYLTMDIPETVEKLNPQLSRH